MNTKQSIWEIIVKVVVPLDLLSGLGFAATLILPDAEGAMGWANSHGLVLVFGTLTLLLTALAVAAWFRARNAQIDSKMQELSSEVGKVRAAIRSDLEQFQRRAEEIQVRATEDGIKRLVREVYDELTSRDDEPEGSP